MYPVNLRILDKLSQKPIQGVGIKFFNPGTLELIDHLWTRPTEEGVYTILPEGTYQVRLFKFGVRFPVQQIEVKPETNNLTLVGWEPVIPESSDPRLCCASGFFRRADGSPYSGLSITLTPTFYPFLLDGEAVMPSSFGITTQKDGFAQVNLVRLGIYTFLVEGFDAPKRRIMVPDAPSCGLPLIMYPRVHRIEINPIQLAVSGIKTIPAKVILADGSEALNDTVTWTVEGDQARIVQTCPELKMEGLKRGTCSLVVKRAPMKYGPAPVYYPDTPLMGTPTPVIVS